MWPESFSQFECNHSLASLRFRYCPFFSTFSHSLFILHSAQSAITILDFCVCCFSTWHSSCHQSVSRGRSSNSTLNAVRVVLSSACILYSLKSFFHDFLDLLLYLFSRFSTLSSHPPPPNSTALSRQCQAVLIISHHSHGYRVQCVCVCVCTFLALSTSHANNNNRFHTHFVSTLIRCECWHASI